MNKMIPPQQVNTTMTQFLCLPKKVLSQDADEIIFSPPPKDHPLMFTCDQKWTIALLKLLDDMNAPDYAFEAIIKWGRAAKGDNYSFHPEGGLPL